jgi:phosphogluconate dehydratase
VLVSAADWDARSASVMPEDLCQLNRVGMGRELFTAMRRHATSAEEGACSWL